MNTKNERLADTFSTLSSPIILEYIREHGEQFGIVSVLKTEISKDRSYADIYISSTENEDGLPKFLAPLADILWRTVAKQIPTYKIPRVRFKRVRNKEAEKSVYDLITELSKQHDLHADH